MQISTTIVTENVCDIMSKENTLVLPLNTDTSQLSDNSTIRLIPTNCRAPQLANIVDSSSTDQATDKIGA